MALLGEGDAVGALKSLENAHRIRSAITVGPEAVAMTEFALARALWDMPVSGGRDRVRARKLATRAQEAFAGLGVRLAGELASVTAWLAARESSHCLAP